MRTRLQGILKSTIALALLSAVLSVACNATDAELQDKNWTNPGDLVDTSDRVMVAVYVGSRTETVQIIDSQTGEISGESERLFREFEVFDSIKGTADEGDPIWIGFSRGELVRADGSMLNLAAGESYVLFLKGRLRPLEYPDFIGGVLWTGNGEPSFAELVGDTLEFRASRQYVDLLARQDRLPDDSSSAAPFSLTLPEVRNLVD